MPLETSRVGLFAAGDVRHGSTKRVAAAVGEGSMVASLIFSRLGRAWRHALSSGSRSSTRAANRGAAGAARRCSADAAGLAAAVAARLGSRAHRALRGALAAAERRRGLERRRPLRRVRTCARGARGAADPVARRGARAYVRDVRERVLERLPDLRSVPRRNGRAARAPARRDDGADARARRLARHGRAARGSGRAATSSCPAGRSRWARTDPWAYDNERPRARRRAAEHSASTARS